MCRDRCVGDRLRGRKRPASSLCLECGPPRDGAPDVGSSDSGSELRHPSRSAYANRCTLRRVPHPAEIHPAYGSEVRSQIGFTAPKLCVASGSTRQTGHGRPARPNTSYCRQAHQPHQTVSHRGVRGSSLTGPSARLEPRNAVGHVILCHTPPHQPRSGSRAPMSLRTPFRTWLSICRGAPKQNTETRNPLPIPQSPPSGTR